MPLPFILGAVGVGAALYVAADISEDCDTLKAIEDQHKSNLQKFEREKKATCEALEALSKLELEILHGCEEFLNTYEKIKNRPLPVSIKAGITPPKYNIVELKEVLMGAGVNATGKLSEKSDEAWKQMRKAEDEINNICSYLRDLKTVAINYTLSLKNTKNIYSETFSYISYIINEAHKTDWNDFSHEEQQATTNCLTLAGHLHTMCQIYLINQSKLENGIYPINQPTINQLIQCSESILEYIRHIEDFDFRVRNLGKEILAKYNKELP